MRALVFLALAPALFAQQFPILGLAHVGLKVSDIDKAGQFYGGVLGLDMAFDLKVLKTGALFLQYYKF